MRPKLTELLSQVFPLEQTVRITVRGGSMHPYILDGDAVDIVTPENLRKGDIVIFRHSEMLIAHRVIRLSDECIYARGDASPSMEEVSRSRILGKVIARYRKGRKVAVTGTFSRIYSLLLPWSRLAHRAWNKLLRY